MNENELNLTDEEMDEYLDIALAVGTRTQFSKGTMNVSPGDLKKLRPLVKFYAKKPHPFRACVADNEKRFGPLTEKYCAIIKDLIKGTTAWRGTERKKNLSEGTLFELFALDVPKDFFALLSELTDEEVEAMMNEEEDKETELSEENQTSLMAEMFFTADDVVASEGDDGLVWKPIMREGIWKYSPSSKGAAPKPIQIIRDGKSNKEDLVISMSELKSHFEKGVIEHVTIPASHADKVLENTGFIKKLRFGVDKQGRAVLEAGHEFTEPDVKEKALRGTIANTSAGILYDYIHKETGEKYGSVLAHVALTNRPWLNGMKPFGVNASDDLEVIGFSEEPTDDLNDTPGGEVMPEEVTFDFSELGFENREALEAALSEARDLKAKARERDVEDLCKKWQEEGKTPALVACAQEIMMSDEGATVLNLSEGGKAVELSASDIVKRLVDKSASVKLSEAPVSDQDVSGETPEDNNNEEVFSQEEKVLASRLYFDEGLPYDEALAKAKERLAKEVSQ